MITLCMIVKNEADFLDISLASAAKYFTDIVVVDTGSTDNSNEIAGKYGARVYDFTWVNDFAAARNFAAKQAKHDWILMLDADEEIVDIDAKALSQFVSDKIQAGTMLLVELLDNSHNHITRLYNRTVYEYTGKIHEYVTAKTGETLINQAPVRANHHGYLPQYNRTQGKLARNEELLLSELEKDPQNPYLLFQLGKTYFCDSRDLTRACEYFEKALALKPDPRLEYVYNMVECFGYGLINTNQAIRALNLRIKYAPMYDSRVEFRFLSGHILQANAKFADAVDLFESCIGVDTDDFRGITSFLAWYNIGVLLEVVGMNKEAIEIYKKCGDYAPALNRLQEVHNGS